MVPFMICMENLVFMKIELNVTKFFFFEPNSEISFVNFVLYGQLNIVEGKMQYLFDENGKRYLDAFAGIVTVSCGHCHPEVLNAIIEQSKLLQHATTIYLHHAIADFAEALASKMPGNLKASILMESVWNVAAVKVICLLSFDLSVKRKRPSMSLFCQQFLSCLVQYLYLFSTY